MGVQHFDVIMIGAGLSGIGTACHIAKKCPDKTIAILERRENMGGTWDLFKYPGIRSDSDMASFGFRFKPWLSSKVLAKGGDIRDYVIETAREYGLKDKVQFGLKIIKSEWSSDDQHWKLTALHEASGEEKHFTCGFLSNCTGYYNFDEGYSPEFAGSDDFKGKIIHPQHWPEDLDYSGKKVVVIGSGATAVTLIPSMSDKTEHITMLQRSPTYIMPLPDNDTMAVIMNKFLPQNWVFKFARLRNTLFQRGLYLSAMRWPKVIRKLLLGAAKKRLGDGVDMRHFTPKYNPWEERLCAAPDGDLFECVKSGKASVVTDHIDRFTEKGILLKSGTELEADIIVTATGLNIQMMGGMDVAIDGKKTSIAEKMVYKSVLIEDFPNFAWIFGYTNVPWTLKSDIAGQYICRLFKHMDANNLKTVTPIDSDNNRMDVGMLDEFAPGYVQRARNVLPRQGRSGPWKVLMHYGKDKKVLLNDPVVDGVLSFEKENVQAQESQQPNLKIA